MTPNKVRDISPEKDGTKKLGQLLDGRRINVRMKSSAKCPTLEIYNPINQRCIKIRYIGV